MHVDVLGIPGNASPSLVLDVQCRATKNTHRYRHALCMLNFSQAINSRWGKPSRSIKLFKYLGRLLKHKVPNCGDLFKFQ